MTPFQIFLGLLGLALVIVVGLIAALPPLSDVEYPDVDDDEGVA